MKKMKFKNIILAIVLAFSFSAIFAQKPVNQTKENTPMAKALQKLRWDINLGTSFMYSPGFGGGMNYYAAPGFSYPVNKKVSFHGGVVVGVMTSPGFHNTEEGFEKITSGYTSIYGTVAYRLNPNVVFYGTGVKNLATFGPMNPFYSPSFDEFSFGSSIRLGDNVTIGASFHFREYSPMNGGYFAPFGE